MIRVIYLFKLNVLYWERAYYKRMEYQSLANGTKFKMFCRERLAVNLGKFSRGVSRV